MSVILHHYPQSPVAEKVRAVLGIKALTWHSVEIPRIPPKPDLMPLTGGYRRTPVMQVGADIYCDSQCIMRELERRFPEPTLTPGGSAGMAWGLSRWTDGPLFEQVVSVVLGAAADSLPEAFAADRGRLYFGESFDLRKLTAELEQTLSQIRAQLAWVDERLSDQRPFMLGDAPGLPDALCHHIVWFLRGRFDGGPKLLDEFPALCAWEERMIGIGHGTAHELDAKEALNIAATATPETQSHADTRDPQNLRPGELVAVVPAGDGGDPPVHGKLVKADAQTVCLARNDEQVGAIHVHFPRVGYVVSKL